MRLSFALEQANSGDSSRYDRRAQRTKRCGNIFGAVAIDVADKTKRQVKLVVILPARSRNAMHRGAEQVADWARRAQGNEQAVLGHGAQRSSIAARAGTAILNFLTDNNVAGMFLRSGFA